MIIAILVLKKRFHHLENELVAYGAAVVCPKKS